MTSIFKKPYVFVATCFLSVAACGNEEGSSQGQDPSIPVILGQSEQPTNNGAAEQPAPRDLAQAPDTPAPPADSSQDPNDPQPPTTPSRPVEPTGSTLTVEINGIRNVKGNVCLSMFNSPQGYPDSASQAVLAKCFTVVSRSFEIRIEGVADGTYGIAMWHDENRDEKLNYNFLGIPKEGLAFSENGKPRITPPPPGPPSFSSISFEIRGEPRRTSAKMTYLLDFL